jgi:cytochrome c553
MLKPLQWILFCLWAAIAPVIANSASSVEAEYVAAMGSEPDLQSGQKAYETCAACHGPDGSGTGDGYIPIIAAQHYRYVARTLITYRYAQRMDPRMEHFADKHHLRSAQEIADVAYYVSKLDPVNTKSTGDGLYLEHGAGVFERQCRSCHGDTGNGTDEKRIPRLAGQHSKYLLRQLHDALDGRRPNFPQEHVRLIQDFEKADLEGVSDHLSRQRAHIPD